jgi:hypothetical protein
MTFNNTISEEMTFNRDVKWLFEFTQNFEERKKWDKQTPVIEFIEGSTHLEKGAKVFTRSVEGVEMDTEYLTFDPPYRITIKMLDKSSVFKSFVGSWHYLSEGEETTTLRMTYQFDLRFPYKLLKGRVEQKIRTNMKNKLQMLSDHLKGS